jgi:hypothetical protein
VIKPTDEMKAAVAKRMGVPDGAAPDPWMEPAIQDVLAIVERDWNMQPNPNAPRWRCNTTERCLLEDGHEGPHGFGAAAWKDCDA